MIVAGHEIPQSAVRAVTERIRAQTEPFRAADVSDWLRDAGGVPNGLERWLSNYIAYHATGRLLQFERRAGRIVFSGGKWRVRK